MTLNPLLGKKHIFITIAFIAALFSQPVFAEEEATAATPVYIELSPDFIVNYSSSGSRLSYIKTKISLRSDSSKEAVIQANMPIVRDAIVMFLSSRTKDQVTGAVAREKTREDAKVAVNDALQEETGVTPVIDVLFASFVTQ